MFFRTLTASLFVLAACSKAPPEPAAPPSGWSLDPGGDLNAFFDCLEAEGIALVSAHRGGPAPSYPENAVETFARTLSLIPAVIEMDVAQSADGVLFLMHDEGLERTTTGEGEAAAQRWGRIENLRLEDETGRATTYRPARFSEALRLVANRTVAQIDFKRSARYEDAVAEIRAAGAGHRVILIAYTLAQAQKLHRLAPEMMISLNMQSISDLNAAVASGIPADRLLGFTGVDEPRPRAFRALGERRVEVIFGTLGGAGSIDRRLAALGDDALYADLAEGGVDIIATDRPLEAQKALDAAGRGVRAGVCGAARN
ncbi:MAG: glycerophosphodiester phosphodiesterase family protein [Pseudomonadota bacterium]|nr:glycerophosphodiester phosphodiesterase family protein [Pseudomonadota bacterium]